MRWGEEWKGESRISSMLLTSVTQWTVVTDTEVEKVAMGKSSKWRCHARYHLDMSLELKGETMRVYRPLDGEAGSGRPRTLPQSEVRKTRNRQRKLTSRRQREHRRTGQCGMTNRFDSRRKGWSGMWNAA